MDQLLLFASYGVGSCTFNNSITGITHNFDQIRIFKTFFTYPPLVAGRLPDGKIAPIPKTPRDSKGFVTSDPKITTGRIFELTAQFKVGRSSVIYIV